MSELQHPENPPYSSTRAGMTEGALLLRAAIKARALTYKAAGELVGLSEASIANYASAHCTPPRYLKLRIQKTFGVPAEAWSVAVAA